MNVTISGGIAEYNGEPEMALLHMADPRLYSAKSEGRNRINKLAAPSGDLPASLA